MGQAEAVGNLVPEAVVAQGTALAHRADGPALCEVVTLKSFRFVPGINLDGE